MLDADAMAVYLGGPFLGVEALESGQLRKHQLRGPEYAAIFPGVYLPGGTQPTFAQRVEAAWLWTRREGVIAGMTAARLYGAKWVDDSLPIELVWPNARPPKGIATGIPFLAAGETASLSGIPVTSLLRTAFDLARRAPWSTAVARVDALGNGTRFDRAALCDLASRHKGVRGIRQFERVLDMHDPGAESPKETWLRLLVIGAGFPRPKTQIPVRCGARTYYLDMDWEAIKVAVEYDGDQHRTDHRQFGKDIVRLEDLARLGWIVIRVAASTPPTEVIRRLQGAWAARTSSTLR